MGLGPPGPQSIRFAFSLLLLAWSAVACTTPPPERADQGPLVGPTVSPGAEVGSVLRLSTLEPDSLDPIDLDATHELLLADQIYDGLIEYEPQASQAVPALARDWTVGASGKEIEFRLRKGLRYHDGTPVTAGDFVTAWSRLADPIVAAPFGFLLEQVAGYDAFQSRPVDQLEGLEAPDDRTLVVRLQTAWPDFVSLTGHPALAPLPDSADEAGFGANPVGTGPYRMTDGLTPEAPLVLERFPGFYGEPPVTDEIHLEFTFGPEDAWPDFLAGELDQATVPASALADAQGRYGGRGIVPLARLLYCGFNQEDPRLAHPELRLAVSSALDRLAIVEEVYGGVPIPATGMVPPSVPGALADACGERCVMDTERARSLSSSLPRESRSFALDYAASPHGGALAAVLAEQLRVAGLKVTPRPHGLEDYLRLLLEERQDFFCLVWTADYPRQQALLDPLLLPGSEDNHAGIDDPGLTELLQAARAQRSPTMRQQLYAEAEQRALSRMQVVPLVWFRSRIAVQPYVQGLTVDPLGMFDAAALSIQP